MLRIVLKNGESLKLGEDIIVKSMTEGRCELAIDAPREVKIERVEAGQPKAKSVSSTAPGADGKKKYVVVNHKQ